MKDIFRGLGFFRPTNGIQWLTLLLIPALAAGFIYGFKAISDVQKHQNDALRGVLCHAEVVVRTSPGLTSEQRRAAIKFYNQELDVAHLTPCK